MQLAARALAIRHSLENLRQQQSQQGVSLRPDIAAASNRMDSFMLEAQSALNAGDPASARRNMDLAEREIDKLEAFFGR